MGPVKTLTLHNQHHLKILWCRMNWKIILVCLAFGITIASCCKSSPPPPLCYAHINCGGHGNCTTRRGTNCKCDNGYSGNDCSRIGKIFMTIARCRSPKHFSDCSGHNITVKIQTGLVDCTVPKKTMVSPGELVVWGKDEKTLGDCATVPIDKTTNVWLMTDALNDQFLPSSLEIYMDGHLKSIWNVKLGPKTFNTFVNSATTNTNDNRLSIVKTWQLGDLKVHDCPDCKAWS